MMAESVAATSSPGMFGARGPACNVTPGSGFYLRVESEQLRKIGVDRVWAVRKN